MGASVAYVIDEYGRTQGTCVDLSDGVSLEIFECGLFGAAPGSECTERADVPTDQRCDPTLPAVARPPIEMVVRLDTEHCTTRGHLDPRCRIAA